jgi:hypothetical protein
MAAASGDDSRPDAPLGPCRRHTDDLTACRAELRPNAVQRTKSARIVMDQKGAVGLEHEEPHGFREPSGQASRVKHLTTCDEPAHGLRTVMSVSDMTRATLREVALNLRAVRCYVRESRSGSSRATLPPGLIGCGRRGSRTQASGGGSSRRKSPQRCSVRRKRKTANMQLNTFLRPRRQLGISVLGRVTRLEPRRVLPPRCGSPASRRLAPGETASVWLPPPAIRDRRSRSDERRR